MNKAVTATLLLLAVSAFLFISFRSQQLNEFQKWKQRFGSTFQNQADEFYRRSIFEANLVLMSKHNADTSQTYKMGVNQFTIYTDQEFHARYLSSNLGLSAPRYPIESVEPVISFTSDKVGDDYVDWTERGVVGPVKTQGQCGSGTVYATVGGVESLSAIVTGSFKPFSEQQLLDCVYGCSGAVMRLGYDFYGRQHACTESEYPKQSSPGTCKHNAWFNQCAFRITTTTDMGGCLCLYGAVERGPATVAVDASNWARYASGLFDNCNSYLNHVVLVTGLGAERSYWKVKNSWGTTWGEQGYIRLRISKDHDYTCGVCTHVYLPLWWPTLAQS